MLSLPDRKAIRRALGGALLQTAALLLFGACSAGQQIAQTEPRTLHTPQTEDVSADATPRALTQADEVPIYTYEVVNSWPHLSTHFTQGLVYHDGHLYESTGQYGSSLLCRLELKTGKVQKRVDVAREFFAEGMTIFGDKIYQLTWQAHKGFVYDLKNFERLSEFSYEGEGWGLTNDGHSLLMSDGTNKIRFIDPISFRVVRSVEVFDHNQPLMELNELEYIKGEIYANIWHTDKIVRIDPANGKILAWIDLAGLRRPEDNSDEDNVLNGIAYDEKNDRLFVTGKRWSRMYEIRLVRK
jgi:glutamine cyclotransferase